jgi:hypothetical protein
MKLSLIFSLLLISNSYFAAEKHLNTIPIYSQKLGIEVSSNFKPIHQGPPGNIFLLELIPKAEDLKSWSEMLVIFGFKDLASKFNSKSAFALEADGIKKLCPQDFVVQEIKGEKIQNYDTTWALIGCKKHKELGPDYFEIGIYVFIQGKKDFYQFKKSLRKKMAGAEMPSEKNYKTLAPELSSIKICKNDGQSPLCTLE